MNLMELFIKLTADTSGLDSGLSEAESQTEGFASKTTSKLSAIGKTVGKAALAATAAAATGIAALTKNAVDNYAEYEQLVGGVETLFKESADQVEQYASNAYKTAGMSANAYMETVTSFSASLLSSMDGDTAKAAKKADLAITDMSDNANKMGTSMELIQNAYQGFAKQNYTMLDNLKLGYGGTKEEMERLLEDAEKLSGQEYDISSYADIVDAIHVVQTEMGITGTTAKEAATTIEGSINMTKAAWTNLVTGFGDSNADLSALIGELVESATTAATNIAPVVEQALMSIGEAIAEIGPMIGPALSNAINTVGPSLIESAVSLVTNLVTGIAQAAPQMADGAVELIVQLANGIAQALPTIISSAGEVVVTLATALITHIPDLIVAAGNLVAGLVTGLIQARNKIASGIGQLITTAVSKLKGAVSQFLQAGAQWISNLASGIASKISDIVSKAKSIVTNVVSAIKTGVSQMVSVGGQLIQGLWQGISNKVSWVIGLIKGLGSKIISAAKSIFGIHSPSKVFKEIGGFIVEGFGEGIAPLGELTSGGNINIKTQAKTGSGSDVIDAIEAMNMNMYAAMSAALDNHQISFNNRELGRLVKTYV